MVVEDAFHAKNMDKSKEELVEDLERFRDSNSKLKEVIATYKRILVQRGEPLDDMGDGHLEVRDVSGCKSVDERFREQMEILRLVMDNIPQAVFWKDINSVYLGCNSVFARFAGVGDPKNIVGKTDIDLAWAKEDVESFRRDDRRVMDSNKPLYHIIEPQLQSDGKRAWLDTNKIPMHDDKGRVVGVLGTYEDITERIRNEKELKKSRWILAKSQQIAHVGNWALNLQTNILNWSDEGYRLFGYTPHEVQPSLELLISRIHPDDRNILEKSIDEAKNTNKLYNIDYRIIMPDGSTRYINSVADKITNDSKGNPEWMYGIHQDITKRKQVEKELEEARSQAELYVDLMGHDINNMNQIAQGYLEMANVMLKDDDVSELISKPLEAIKSSSNLIASVRKLQKLKTGELKTEVIDLNDVLSELQVQFSQVPGKEVSINYKPNPGCHILANGLITEVFSNLFGNAIKHSHNKVEITLKIETIKEAKKKYFEVIIDDNGPGIPDQLKEKIFARFQGGKVKTVGKGLGLYLVKTLVDGFHGRVWAEDRVQGDHTKGSRFVVLLPAVV